MLKYGTNTIGKLYFGSNAINKAYYGSSLVFQVGGGPTPPPVPTANYSIYGNPSINDYIFTSTTSNDGFIYVPEPFSPGAQKSWKIQVKIKIKTAVAWKDIVSTMSPEDGGLVRSICSQTRSDNSNTQTALYLSSNESSWNLMNSECKINIPTGDWYVYQIVCDYGVNYSFKQGFPDNNSWSSVYTTNANPIYNKYIGFGRNGIDADYDLTETKIWVDNTLWWEAINNI